MDKGKKTKEKRLIREKESRQIFLVFVLRSSRDLARRHATDTTHARPFSRLADDSGDIHRCQFNCDARSTRTKVERACAK